MDYIYIYIYRDFWLQNVSLRRCRWKLITENFNKNSQESDLTRISSSFSWIFLKMGPVPAFRWSFKWDVSLEKGENSDLGTPKQSSAYFASFSGKKHQMFGWKPPPSGRLFLGGFINLPKDYLGGNQPLLFVHFDWTTQENEQSLVSGARACGKMHETFMYQNYAEQRGAKNQVSIWLQKFPCQMFFTVCHGRTIDFMAVAENLPKDIWYMRLSFEGIFVAVHLVFAAAFQALSKGYEAPDPTCAMGGMGSCCPGPDDKEGGLQRRSKVELKHII